MSLGVRMWIVSTTVIRRGDGLQKSKAPGAQEAQRHVLSVWWRPRFPSRLPMTAVGDVAVAKIENAIVLLRIIIIII